MELTVENLYAVFTPQGAEDSSLFEYDAPSESFSGHVVRADFRRKKISERQKEIWEQLRNAFGEQTTKVSIIFAFTPEEWKELQEDIA